MNGPTRGVARALVIACAAVGLGASAAPGDGRVEALRRTATRTDVPYGPDASHRLDLWKAGGRRPAPVVVFLHGGGFRTGDKKSMRAEAIDVFLKRGISVAAVNYRLSGQAVYPAAMLDAARAVQFLRWKGRRWGIDPAAVGAIGGSAGGSIALWLAYHDDLADPADPDPVRRQSTRLLAAGAVNAPTTFEPDLITELVSDGTARSPALARFFDVLPGQEDTDATRRLYAEASPARHVTPDDPPVLLYHSQGDAPVSEHMPPGHGVHSAAFGEHLRSVAEPLGVEVSVREPEDYEEPAGLAFDRELVEFFARRFALPAGAPER